MTPCWGVNAGELLERCRLIHPLIRKVMTTHELVVFHTKSLIIT
jgi:hypothetical protein